MYFLDHCHYQEDRFFVARYVKARNQRGDQRKVLSGALPFKEARKMVRDLRDAERARRNGE